MDAGGLKEQAVSSIAARIRVIFKSVCGYCNLSQATLSEDDVRTCQGGSHCTSQDTRRLPLFWTLANLLCLALLFLAVWPFL